MKPAIWKTQRMNYCSQNIILGYNCTETLQNCNILELFIISECCYYRLHESIAY